MGSQVSGGCWLGSEPGSSSFHSVSMERVRERICLPHDSSPGNYLGRAISSNARQNSSPCTTLLQPKFKRFKKSNIGRGLFALPSFGGHSNQRASSGRNASSIQPRGVRACVELSVLCAPALAPPETWAGALPCQAARCSIPISRRKFNHLQYQR